MLRYDVSGAAELSALAVDPKDSGARVGTVDGKVIDLADDTVKIHAPAEGHAIQNLAFDPQGRSSCLGSARTLGIQFC